MSDVVIIGAGQAGFSVAERLRRQGFEGNVTLLGAEPDPPYQRPPLSKKYLTGEMTRERLFFRPPAYFEENNIAIRLGKSVTSIDRDAKTVSLGDAQIPYDHLVLATGSQPRNLPAKIGGDLPGVFTVRNLADVDAMSPRFGTGKRALIVGGGYIGLEAAAVASTSGMDVTLIEAADRILGRVASPQTASYFRALHNSHGVDVREGSALSMLSEANGVLVAKMADGSEIPADVVIVGIGITPDTALAEDAGLTVENGIVVDETCRTSDQAIFAAGDCAEFPHGDTRLRLESVGNAIDMGEAVANAIMGQDVHYVAQPWFWSDQFDVTLQIAGLSAGHTDVVTRPGERDGAVSWWYFAGRKLLCVDAANDARAYMFGKRWISQDVSPDLDAIADPEQALKSMTVA